MAPHTSTRAPAVMAVTLLAAAGVFLSGCSRDTEDLQAYIEDVRARPARQLEPVPEPEPARSHRYPEMDLRDPFAELSFAEPEAEQVEASSGPSPDPDRPREPLEEFPLDSLKMAGILEQDGQRWALIRDPDGTIHRVQEGNYLGQNHGEILDITEQRVEILELVQGQGGRWREREASLTTRE